MSIKMPKDVQQKRLRWVLPVISKKIRLKDIIGVCPHSERSLKRWCKAYREKGKKGLIPKNTAPKTQPNETPIRIKEEVISLRKQTNLCSLKLHWKLKKKGLVVPLSTIGKILKDEKLDEEIKTLSQEIQILNEWLFVCKLKCKLVHDREITCISKITPFYDIVRVGPHTNFRFGKVPMLIACA